MSENKMSFAKYCDENRCPRCGHPPKRDVYAPEDGGCPECGAYIRDHSKSSDDDDDDDDDSSGCVCLVMFILLAIFLYFGGSVVFKFLWKWLNNDLNFS